MRAFCLALVGIAASVLASCSLLLDFSDPVPSPDAAWGFPDAGPDSDEPNETAEAATPLPDGIHRRTIYPALDQDWFVFTTEKLTDIHLFLDHVFADGGVEVELYGDPASPPLARTATAADVAAFNYLAPAGTFYLRAFALEPTVVNDYLIELTLTEQFVPVDAGPPD